jgi:hypothetical protein
MLQSLRRSFTGRESRSTEAASPESRRRRASRPSLESLEGRMVLSFIGSEKLVSPADARSDYSSANASSANGTSVIVWTHEYSVTDRDIYAQRYDKYGSKLGGIVYVDTSTVDAGAPSVAMDATGRFAVTYNNFYSNGTSDIQLRLFSAAGALLTSTRVSDPSIDTSSGYGLYDYSSDVAFQGSNIAVAYQHYYSSTDSDILGRRFTYTPSAGLTNLGPVYVATTGTYNEYSPSIAMSPNGRFSVAYQRTAKSGTFDSDVLLNRYSNTGSLLGTSAIAVDSTTGDFAPDVAMDNAGNAVVAWQHAYSGSDHDIYARRVSSGGTLGPVVYVRTAGTYDYAPSVALAPTTGHFVVAYVVSGSTSQIGASEFDANNARLTDSPLVSGYDASISIDGFNRYLVTYSKTGSSVTDVYSRRDFVS